MFIWQLVKTLRYNQLHYKRWKILKIEITPFQLRERAVIQWYHRHIVTTWGSSCVVKELPGTWSDITFLKLHPKGQLYQSLPLCVKHSVCWTPPQSHYIRISGDRAHDSGCLINLTDDSVAHCVLGVSDLSTRAHRLAWKNESTMGQQLRVGSKKFCVKHRRLDAWWVLAGTGTGVTRLWVITEQRLF